MASQRTPLRPVGDHLMLEVWVVPGASRTECKGLYDGALRLRVASPPSGGQANRAIVRFLQKKLACAVTVERGASSRRKRLRIDSTDLAGVAEVLDLAG